MRNIVGYHDKVLLGSMGALSLMTVLSVVIGKVFQSVPAQFQTSKLPEASSQTNLVENIYIYDRDTSSYSLVEQLYR